MFDAVLSEHQRILHNVIGSFIVGSYLVTPEYKDIDIVIPYSAYMTEACTSALGEYHCTSKDDPEYDRSDLSCLHMTFRSPDNKVNILIVNDEYIAAYKAAVNHAKRCPEEQATREQRVDVYYYYECLVRHMLGE
ncbi:hypothetical protein CPT_Palo_027 [Rhizobium phage Palo]|uniref:Uncharacterized protein n=1 Tax=Rhizobium phage Palo TaxID=2767573 RepID=A0A7L8G4J4_9CAUD|nr:hypothetical protein CPT_Palo_027 [Rhizobium phage Palo]